MNKITFTWMSESCYCFETLVPMCLSLSCVNYRCGFTDELSQIIPQDLLAL